MKRRSQNSEEWSQNSVRDGDDAQKLIKDYSCSHSVFLLLVIQIQTALSIVTLTSLKNIVWVMSYELWVMSYEFRKQMIS